MKHCLNMQTETKTYETGLSVCDICFDETSKLTYIHNCKGKGVPKVCDACAIKWLSSTGHCQYCRATVTSFTTSTGVIVEVKKTDSNVAFGDTYTFISRPTGTLTGNEIYHEPTISFGKDAFDFFLNVIND